MQIKYYQSSEMARRSKKVREHEQLPLFKQRGGKRRGAGRKARGRRASERHKTRPKLNARHPVHVVLRVVAEVGNLRRRHAYRAIREATITAAGREDFRIVHLSIQHNHVHLLVEADRKEALSSGMQRFQISAAKHLNAEVGKATRGARRRGTVFPDRYHAKIITSPRQARHALNYVINNWRKHREDRGHREQSWRVDPYSTGVMFPDWKERVDEPFLWRGPATYDPLVVYRPRTWLLREAWKKHGLISYREVPSSQDGQAGEV
jgi:REP element-mobilizing transposase RayT